MSPFFSQHSRSSGPKTTIFILSLFFVIGMGLLIFGIQQARVTKQRQGSWPHATATVVDHQYRRTTRSSGSGSNSREIPYHAYCAIWEYDPAGDALPVRLNEIDHSSSCKEERATSEDNKRQAERKSKERFGDTKKIQYDPDKTSSAITDGKGAYTLSMVLGGMGLVFAGIAVGSLITRLIRGR